MSNPPANAQAASDPGRGLGIAGLICAIIPCVSFIGLVLSVIALIQSRQAGYRNNIALAGIVVAAASSVLAAILHLTGAIYRALGLG